MDKIQLFEPGTYVTNGDVRGIVRGYSDNRCGVEFYIAHYRWSKNGSFNKESSYLNDGSFREMNESEINEFNQFLLNCGYVWDSESMKVIDLKELKGTTSTDNKDMVKKEDKPKYKTGDFLTSIDGDETFIFMRYEEDGWLLGWNIVFGIDECCNKCEVQRFNPAHPWQYSTDYDKEQFLYKLKDTCYVWHDYVKEMRKEYELDDDKLKCGDIIYLREGETVIFKEITADKLKMRVWHAPTDGNVLTEYNRFIPWKYATGDEQDFILNIMAGNGYVWDKDENHFFSNPKMIRTNINSIVVEKPHKLPPINIPEGYRANIENGKIYFTKEFKDGDFIKTKTDSAIAIFKEITDSGEIVGYVLYVCNSDDFMTAEDVIGHNLNDWTYATDKDIQLFKDRLAEQNYKWDEKRKELVNSFWVPENGETYFFISRHFNVIEAKIFDGEVHQKRLLLHNCFKTKEDATELAKEMKQMFINFNKEKYGKEV
jgi:hypothetical protein|nr:MAG TPA: hypothetical protein [Ackermannviridae sp.]